MQAIEFARENGGASLDFITAAGFKPVDDSLDWRRRKRMERKGEIVLVVRDVRPI